MNRGGYESYYHRSQRVDYTRHYVDYGSVKGLLRDFYVRRRSFLAAIREGGARRHRNDGDVDLSRYPDLSAVIFAASTSRDDECDVIDDDDDDLEDGADAMGRYRLHRDDDYERSSSSSSYPPPPPPSHASDAPPPIGTYVIDVRVASRRLARAERREFDDLLQVELRRAASFYVDALLPNVRRLLPPSPSTPRGGIQADDIDVAAARDEYGTMEDGAADGAHVVSYANAASSLLKAVAFAITTTIRGVQLDLRRRRRQRSRRIVPSSSSWQWCASRLSVSVARWR